MSSETPGQGAVPGWGQPPAPEDDAPTEPVPPVAPVAPGTAPWGQPPAQPAAPPATFPAAPAWGQQPSPPPDAPAAPAPAAPAWGQQPSAPQPQAPTTAAPGWGQPPSAPPPQAPATPAPQWTQPPAQQPGWGVPPQPGPGQPAWNAAPPQQPVPQPAPGQPAWNPAPQQPAWNAAPPVVPGQPGWSGQQPGWNGAAPPPPKSGNGCLKACLIVAVVGIVLFVLALIALYAAGSSLLGGLGVNSDGTLKACPLVSNADLAPVLGKDTVASQLSGLAGAAFGQILDKRVLANETDCWVGAGNSATGGLGRIAKYSGFDAASKFQAEKAAAQSGSYYAVDVSGVGDEAFCTGMANFIATGVLVRKGNDLVYVSLIAASASGPGFQTTDSGVLYDPQSCQVAQQVAKVVLK
jgi:hypothetical protein